MPPTESAVTRPASRTALGAATLCAVHQLLDAEPKILDDPVVSRLIGAALRERIRADPRRFQTPTMDALRAALVVRSRYAEDRLALAVDRGSRQYVILGAGLDTFAYRQPPWARRLRIFEVDHPASQDAKRARLASAEIAVPPNVVFVAVALEAVSLRDGLRDTRFDPGAPAFLSWLGVTVYLTAEAIDAVLRFVASLPTSSEIVFTIAPPPPALDRIAARAAARGEPWRTRLDLDTWLRNLHALGFSAVALLTPSDVEERYIRGRRDGLRAPRGVRALSATV